MTLIDRAGQSFDAGLVSIPGDAAPVDLRAVHRAVADLRRGVPVVIEHAAGRLGVVAAETVGHSGLAELQAVTDGAPVVVLAASRAAALIRLAAEETEVVAVRIAGGVDWLRTVRRLADPTQAAEPPGGVEPAALPPAAVQALQLAKLARLLPSVVAGPLDPDADLSRLLSVRDGDIAAYESTAARALIHAAEAHVPLADAPDSRVVSFRGPDGGVEHLAVLVGRPEAATDGPAPLVRIHSECFTGDLLGSLRCDCGPQLHRALRRMNAEGAGVLLYLAQEGRGIGLANKLRAYALQDSGLDTLDANHALGWGADERDFSVAATMLRALGIRRVRLLTNNPRKIAAVEAGGVAVERVAHIVAANGVNDAYLATKARRFGHLLDDAAE